jgi:hypothetical protein
MLLYQYCELSRLTGKVDKVYVPLKILRGLPAELPKRPQGRSCQESVGVEEALDASQHTTSTLEGRTYLGKAITNADVLGKQA